MSTNEATRRRRHRGSVVVFSIILGAALGLALGSFAALTDWWGAILFLLIPVAARVVARLRGHPDALEPIAWIWPIVALVLAIATYLLVSPITAPFGLGLGVAAWFALIVVGGVVEVVFDPDGRIAGTTD